MLFQFHVAAQEHTPHIEVVERVLEIDLLQEGQGAVVVLLLKIPIREVVGKQHVAFGGMQGLPHGWYAWQVLDAKGRQVEAGKVEAE